MASSLREVQAISVALSQPAADAGEAVRLGEVEALLADKSDTDHVHLAAHVTDLSAAVHLELSDRLGDSSSIGWLHGSGTGSDGHVPAVIVKPSGGLELTEDGVAVVSSGTGAFALREYVDDLAHDPVTGSGTGNITLTIGEDQVLDAEVKLAPNPDGIRLGEDAGGRLYVVAGSGTDEAARGDHDHGGDYEMPLLVENVGHTVLLTLSGTETESRTLSADVVLDADPVGHGYAGIALREGAQGLFVPVGGSGTEAAAGDHVHAAATSDEAGFMSAADKVKLDGLVGEGGPFAFRHFDEVPSYLNLSGTGWLDGLGIWPTDVGITRVDALYDAASAPITLEAYVGATLLTLSGTGEEFILLAGLSGTQLYSSDTYADLTVPADTLLRWKVVAGGPGSGNVTLIVRAVPS
jgi:hypothetical protein